MQEEKKMQEMSEAVQALRDKIDKGLVDKAEYKDALDEIDKKLDKFDDEFQEKYLDRVSAEKKEKENQERLEALELEVVKATSGAHSEKDYKQKPEYKAFENAIRTGNVSPEEMKLLRTDNDTSGGYLTESEMDSMIVKTITEISPIRSLARVQTVSKKTLDVPIRKTLLTADYEGEAEEGTTDNSTYGSETLTAYRLTTTVPFTLDMLGDSSFNLESEINSDVAEAFAFKEGNKFVLGTGIKQPEGFLVNSGVQTNAFTSESVGVITGDDLINLTGQLKAGYNGVFGFNRKTRATIRRLKGTDGHYLWIPTFAPGEPATINGDPYVVIQDMPEIAASNYPVVYADFSRGYKIIDRTGMAVVRDELTRKKNAIVELTFHRWNHGKVILPEAFVPLKVKA